MEDEQQLAYQIARNLLLDASMLAWKAPHSEGAHAILVRLGNQLTKEVRDLQVENAGHDQPTEVGNEAEGADDNPPLRK